MTRRRPSVGRTSRARLLIGVVATAVMALSLVGSANAIAAGAAFTTTNPAVDGPGTCFNGPGVVNCNIYNTKSDVWINGGPNQPGPSALADGYYFFVVIVPGGESAGNDYSINDGTASGEAPKNLSDTNDIIDDAGDAYTNRIFHVSGGDIDSYSGTHTQYLSATQGLQIRLFPYDTTFNSGGEYTVELCKLGTQADQSDWVYPVANDSVCKSDNFKVRQGCVESCVVESGALSGAKYYDTNANGVRDAGEPGISNWPIDFSDGVANTVFTNGNGEFSMNLSPDIYTFKEEVANSPWMQTGNQPPSATEGVGGNQTNSTGGNSAVLNSDKSYTVVVANGGNTDGLYFGNICLGAGGGLTMGYWSNTNGQSTMTNHAVVVDTSGGAAPNAGMTGTLAFLRWLNLRDLNQLPSPALNGLAFDPTIYTVANPKNGAQQTYAYRPWLLTAAATNMAYMLSAQLSAMELNVRFGFVSPSALIYAPGTNSANALGFATVGAIMTEANNDLATNGYTVQSGAVRTHQESLKTALDKANNNLNFVEPGPGSCPTPVFP